MQSGLQELMEARRYIREISHYFREANKPADRLANVGVDSGINSTYGLFSDLPHLVRGDITLDRLGIPSLRRSSASLAC